MPIFDVHNHLGVELGAYGRGEFPYGQSFSALRANARREGVSHLVVFPMVSYLAQQNLADGLIFSRETVPYAWENRRLMAEIYGLFAAQSEHVFPFAMFDPGREIAAQIAALRELKRDFPIYGLKTQPTIIQSPITALNGAGAAILELAREWNVPVLIHSSVFPLDVWSQARDILDIAQKWPAVRFNLAHSCRFDLECLERLALLPNCWFDVSAHGIHCELATQNSPVVAPTERRFNADYAQPAAVLRDLATVFSKKLLWGSDSPYYSFAATVEQETLALLSSFERETGFFQALPDDSKSQIWQNTLDWLGLEEGFEDENV